MCAGCGLLPRHHRVVLPVADRVTRITITNVGGSADQPTAPAPRFPVIEDRERIAQVIKFISKHGNDWRAPRDGDSTAEYTLQIDTEGDKHLLISVGKSWIGARVENATQLQNISARDMAAFREILEIAGR